MVIVAPAWKPVPVIVTGYDTAPVPMFVVAGVVVGYVMPDTSGAASTVMLNGAETTATPDELYSCKVKVWVPTSAALAAEVSEKVAVVGLVTAKTPEMFADAAPLCVTTTVAVPVKPVPVKVRVVLMGAPFANAVGETDVMAGPEMVNAFANGVL